MRSSAANDFEAGAEGARSSVATQSRLVPEFDYVNQDGEFASVRFDGFDESNGVLIDRKLGVATTEKSQLAALRQSMALEQNGYRGVWEVGNQRAYNRATRMLGRLGIDNIDVSLVDP